MKAAFEDAEGYPEGAQPVLVPQQGGAKVGQSTSTWSMMDMVSAFSGLDKTYTAAKFIEDIDDNGDIFEWTERQRLLVARRSLTGTAALWLKSEKVFKTWEEFKKTITKEFPDTIDSKTIHELMSSTKKKPEESCIDYMLNMKALGKRGKLADYVAIKYIVEGIPDREINKVMLYGVTTYGDLKEKLKIYEAIQEKTKQFDDKKRQFSANSVAKVTSNVRCYSCGERKHISSDCPHRKQGKKCFNCNSFGHLSSDCKTTTASAPLAGTSGVKTGPSGNGRKFGSTVQQGRQHAEPKQLMFTEMQDDVERCEVCAGSSDEETDDRQIMLTMVGSTAASDNDVTDGRMKMNCQCQLNINNECGCGAKCLRAKPTKTVEICGKSALSLIDSGSEVNLVTCELFSEIGAPERNVNKCIVLSGLASSKVKSAGQITCDIVIDRRNYTNVKFYVVPKDTIPYKIILGQEFLCKVRMVMSGGSVWFQPSNEAWLGQIECVSNDIVSTDHIVNKEIKEEVLRCAEAYQPLQTREAPIELKIVVKDDRPVSQRPRRISLAEQEEVERQISEWLDKGIVRVSYSEYSSPLVLVRKKDGSIRICVDYRQLNKKILKDEFPLPIIDDYIDKITDARVFSLLDLKNGFFHLRVSEESVKYTAFVSHHGQFEFLRAPFGLKICPNYFMRFVSIIFRDLITRGILIIFIDDVLILAKDEQEALERLKEVLGVMASYGLQINWSKANLICRHITYLGHEIENGEVRPSANKTDAVMKFPEPQTVKQLHSFVGLASYFRKYIRDFAYIAKPLTDLLRKDGDFEFKDEHRHVFNLLKEKLASGPVLKIFNPRRRTELHTDASSLALSAILMQECSDGNLHPVYYMSCKTNEAEKKYSSYELEALAIINGIKKFRHYLYGRHFKIVTDCQAFQMTLQKKDLSTRVARWALLLQEFDYEVEHRSGSRMRHADALSRNPYVAVITNISMGIREAQEQDEGLTAIKEILKEKPYNDYWLDNDILYKGDQKKLVVPRSMEKEIISRAHSQGHFSKKKMIDLIDKDYFIRDINKKVEDVILGCIPCLLATRKEGKQEGYLNPIEKESLPLHSLHLDHIGPITETKKLYNHILTIIDAFTKYVWIFPTKSTTSKETLDKLRVHQQYFGNPSRIITDRGTAFTSKDFEEYCREEDIIHVKITTGVPRGNGQVERMNKVIISVLSKLSIDTPAQWYKHVAKVQQAINSTYQRSINTTPFELLVGVKMKCKQDIPLYELILQEQRDEFSEEREELRMKAKEQIQKVQQENINNFNKKRKQSTKYKEGDLVAIKRTQYGVCMKLKPKFLGPYRVTKVKRNDRYDVQKVDTNTEGPKNTSTTADFMKRWPVGGDVLSRLCGVVLFGFY